MYNHINIPIFVEKLGEVVVAIYEICSQIFRLVRSIGVAASMYIHNLHYLVNEISTL